MKQRHLTGLAFVSLSLAGFALFFLVPFLISIRFSFSRTAGSFDFVGLKNYIDLFHSGSFQLALFNTLKFIVIGVPLLMAFSVFMALAFNYLNKFSVSPVWFALSLIPMVIPSSATVTITRETE